LGLTAIAAVDNLTRTASAWARRSSPARTTGWSRLTRPRTRTRSRHNRPPTRRSHDFRPTIRNVRTGSPDPLRRDLGQEQESGACL